MRQVYEHYTTASWSIGAITRWLNDQRVPTRKPGARWERSMVWAMLRNPAYRGTRVFREDPCGPAPARHARTANARRDDHSEQCQSRAATRGMDRDSGAGAHRRGDVCARAGTAARE